MIKRNLANLDLSSGALNTSIQYDNTAITKTTKNEFGAKLMDKVSTNGHHVGGGKQSAV